MSVIDSIISDYDIPAQIEALYNIAKNCPDIQGAAQKCVNLLSGSYCKPRYVSDLTGGGNDAPSVEFQLQFQQSVENLQQDVDELMIKLGDLPSMDSAVQSVAEDLREASFKLALLHLSQGQKSSASSCLQLYCSNYPEMEFHFRDIERRCYVLFMSEDHVSIRKYSSVSRDDIEIPLSNEESIALAKVKWICLMSYFREGDYQEVVNMFNKASEEERGSFSSFSVLNSYFKPSSTNNCHNFITKNDIYLAVILSVIASCVDSDITSFLDRPNIETFCNNSSDLREFCAAFLQRKFASLFNHGEKLYHSTIRVNYHLAPRWDRFTELLKTKMVIFYLSFVENISLDKLSNRLAIPKVEVLRIVLRLLKRFELNIAYSPATETINRTKKSEDIDCYAAIDQFEAYTGSLLVQQALVNHLTLE